MYTDFYHLTIDPFRETADKKFYYPSEQHEKALSHLSYGIKERKGLMLLTGDVGSGKTTLCKLLIDKCDDSTETILILNPDLSDLELLKTIAQKLGIEEPCHNKYDAIEHLNYFFLNESKKGRNILLIVDEAQKLHTQKLEQLRLLSNLETEKDKLIQIILCGQADLFDKLQGTALRQIDQRITLRFYLSAFNLENTKAYINHRIQTARSIQTHEDFPQFTDDALDAVHRLTGGIPRIINLIASRMLLAGYSLQTFTIDENIAHQCGSEMMLK